MMNQRFLLRVAVSMLGWSARGEFIIVIAIIVKHVFQTFSVLFVRAIVYCVHHSGCQVIRVALGFLEAVLCDACHCDIIRRLWRDRVRHFQCEIFVNVV